MKYSCLLAFLTAVFMLAAPATAQPIVDNWYATVDYDGFLVGGGGSGFNNGAWYEYPSGWLNQWFYDHPFAEDRWKEVHVEFDAYYLDDMQDTYLEVAVNWSTPEWSLLGFGDTTPPTPAYPEAEYIERWTMLETDFFLGGPYEHFSFDYTIPDYNPEWVSIDVYGWNFEIINGVITHECIPEPSTVCLLALGGLALLRRR